MAKEVFGIPVTYKNKLEFIKTLLNVHLAVRPSEENMYEKAKEALAYYIIYGYNKETVTDVETMLSEKIKKGYVRTINSFLRKNGFIVKDKNNKHKSHLSDEMQRYRDHFIINGGKTITIGFLEDGKATR